MATPYAASLTSIALAEFHTYSGHTEDDAPLGERIRQYWQEIALPFPGVETPWSGAFVSWCVRRAGASPQEFRASARHGDYVQWAIGNADSSTGVFHGTPFNSAAVALGDLIQWNRGGGTLDFAHARANNAYASHVAIVVSLGQDPNGPHALTVGGNESDRVRRSRVPLGADGRIVQRQRNPYITLIRTLK